MDELNGNRLEEFRQLRQEVRHSEEHLIVGIGIAKLNGKRQWDSGMF